MSLEIPCNVNKERIPLILLVLALATMFFFANDRGGFYRDGHHNWLSSQNMTVAANLSPEHNFLLFFNRSLDENGETTYTPYSNHPILPHLIIKVLAIVPLGDNLSAQIYVARVLMLLLVAATAILAYLSLLRLSSNSWVSVTATLLAFSSYYMMYYADMVSFEIPSIFGVMLTFHGMVVFVQDGPLSAVACQVGCRRHALLARPHVALSVRGSQSGERGMGSVLRKWAERFVSCGPRCAFQPTHDAWRRRPSSNCRHPVVESRQRILCVG